MLLRIFERLLIIYHFLRIRFRRNFSSRDALRQWQESRLQKQLKFIRSNSSFYRGRLQEPWTSSPMIDKSIMMENFDQLNTKGLKLGHVMQIALQSEQSRDFSPMVKDVTVGLSSGTSGHRGVFCADFYERTFYAGAILAKAIPAGLGKHKVAFFLRANSNLYKSVQSRRLTFRYFDLLEPLEKHVSQLTDLQPTIVVGPPSLLRMLSEEILSGRLNLSNVQRVFSVAEVLDPVDERVIAKAFRQKVHQIYQCTEGFLAISCEMGSLHLNEDMAIVEKEWIDEAAGKFVPIITDLNRLTQPIIRYRLNDILTEDREPCPCGSVMTRLKMIEGRSDDMIEFPKASGWLSVFPDFLRNAILYASSDITEYRVVQLRNKELQISLKGKGSLQDLEAKVRAQLQSLASRLNAEAPIISFKHEFPNLAGKKLRRIERQLL